MIFDPRSTRNSQLLLVMILAGVSLLALALRVWQLELRPMHHDEANQAVRTGILLETGGYRYDPEDHHGPSLYYLSLPLAWLSAGRDFSRTTEVTFRLLPALFGFALVPMLYFLRRGFSVPALAIAGLLTAISPAMVYYSRFYIQEMLLVFFTFGAIVSGWLYFSEPSRGRAVLAGIFLGLMFATKETSVLAYLAMGAGLAAVAATDWQSARRAAPVLLRHLLWLIPAALGTAGLLFSSFLANPVGILDSVKSLHFYLTRGFGDSFHLHPWYFYLKKLVYTHTGRGPHWTEACILVLATLGIAIAWLRPHSGVASTRLVRFLSVYAVVLTAVYSAISYKTPWCMVSFLHALVLLAGVGAGFLLTVTRGTSRALISLLLAGGMIQLTWLSVQANFKYSTDPRNPYVYSQTTPDFLNLVRRIDQIAALAPAGRGLLIEVIADPYSIWPLPWYLRGYSHVGYWEDPERLPTEPIPDLVVTTPGMQPRLPGRLDKGFQFEFYGLRPQVFLLLGIRDDLWGRFIQMQRH